MSIRGVDVASFQGIPGQWKGAAGNIDFAAVKFTELGVTGTRYVNPDAAADWAWLKQQGKARIAYLFAHPATSAAATVELFAFELGRLGFGAGDVIAIDLETADGEPPSRVATWTAQVAELLAGTLDRIPVLYTFLDFAESGNCAGLGHLPLWIADPSRAPGHPRVPAPWSKWAIHQYAITGGIDRDVADYSTAAAMTAALGKQEVDMPLTKADAHKVWNTDGTVASPTGDKANPFWSAAHVLTDVDEQARAIRKQVTALTALVSSQSGLDTDAIIAGVLKGLDPEQLAASIATSLGPDVGQQVLAALEAALASAQGT